MCFFNIELTQRVTFRVGFTLKLLEHGLNFYSSQSGKSLVNLAMKYHIKLLQLCLGFACLHMAVLSSHVWGLGVIDMRWDVFFQY